MNTNEADIPEEINVHKQNWGKNADQVVYGRGGEGSEEIEDDDEEYVEYIIENDDEPRNCYASKKKWCEVEYL